MKGSCIRYWKYWMVVLLPIQFDVYAQLSINGQFRTRTEYRDGQGTLTSKNSEAAFFTSQRTRVSVGYTGYRFRLHSTIQDVRVWGQDASTINRTTTENRNGVMVHEAWAEFSLLDTGSVARDLVLKAGRQELLYDDSRLLGNLDWLQQARRHDAAVVKYSNKAWQVDAGFAFNQNTELSSGTNYNGVPINGTYPAGTNGIGTMYKSLQFLYAKRKTGNGYYSFLFLKDDFNKFHLDTTARILDNGVWSRYTTGLNYSGSVAKTLSLFASAFIQRGKNKNGIDLSTWFLSFGSAYRWSDKFIITLGADWTSGNDEPSTGTDHRFDPLYGTPHKFWGYMDYFYVASPFGVSGLKDYYIKIHLKAGQRLILSFDAHEFFASNKISNETGATLDRRLGTELDLIAFYAVTKEISFEAGYCSMFATSTMSSSRVKNVVNADRVAHWAYVTMNIKTGFLKPSR
jgi:hypothetical protein